MKDCIPSNKSLINHFTKAAKAIKVRIEGWGQVETWNLNMKDGDESK
jgi:hypothetical protein